MLALSAVLSGCGGSRPEEEPRYRESPRETTPEEKAAGVVTFHYANKSTDANLQVDLGATDISLEMTGKPAEAARAEVARKKPERRPEGAGRQAAEEDAADAADPEAEPRERQALNRSGQKNDQRRKQGFPKPEEPAEESAYADEAPQDMTDKVLQGIRKAQEFFYQKRYPEALEMVRQSLDARPTAEGHALAGSIHYMMGSTGLARRQWQEALRINPDMPAVTNMLRKIATPGGRGSPNPRPLAPRRNVAAPSPSVMEAASPMDAPFPEEYGDPASMSPPAPSPAPKYTRPAPAAPQAPAPVEPAPVEEEAAFAPDSPVAAPTAAPAAAPTAAPAASSGKPAESAPAAPASPAAPAAPAPAKSDAPAKPKFPQKASAKDAAAAKEQGK